MSLLTAEIREFVNKVKLGFVATVSPDGTPNLSPKGTTIAWDEQHLVFADIHSPGTISNLLSNASIEINVVDIFSRKGYRFKGMAKVHAQGPVFESVITHYRNSGSKHTIKNVVLIKVDRVLPVWSPAYDDHSSEEEITRRWIAYWDSVNGRIIKN